MATVAVIGANGQLGAEICEVLAAAGWDILPFTHAHFDITGAEAVREQVYQAKPAVVVNTAAMHHVEQCEAEPLQAYNVNALGARNVAYACRDAGAYLIHISTDYVFSGEKRQPYTENDLPSPLNVYGNTKLAGEHFVLASWPHCAVLRTSGLYGLHRCRAKGYNFVELMLKLARERGEVKVVNDEILTPTYTRDLARQIQKLAEARIPLGVCHATNEGYCSWYEFARAIFEIAGVKVTLQVAGPHDFPQKVPRPKYSVLENAKLKSHGLNVMRPWREALAEYLKLRADKVMGKE